MSSPFFAVLLLVPGAKDYAREKKTLWKSETDSQAKAADSYLGQSSTTSANDNSETSRVQSSLLDVAGRGLPLTSSSSVVAVPDFDKTVLPITELNFLGLGLVGEFGTGFCVDPACRFIGTNYHVAMISRPRKIKGERVIQRYLATGPNDEDATVNDGPSMGPMRYTQSRDLAIFELRHPLPRHHGVIFSVDDLQDGQEVDIYAYPKEDINPIRKLIQFHGTFKNQTTAGLLAFNYTLSDGKAICPGASGGIVVDRKTHQIVGILNQIAMNVEAVALAVPVRSLVDFLTRVLPYLAQKLFPSITRISPVSEDVYPKFAPTLANELQHRPEVPPEVTALRSKAHLLAESMRNFIAVQSFAWGSGNKEPAAVATYELRIVDGEQRFREYPDGKKQLKNVAFPPLNKVMRPGGEWSELPERVGTEFRLKIQQAPDVLVNDRKIKVFQYWASPEDGVCEWESFFDFGLFDIKKSGIVACYGEVWTDHDFNILRISEHFELLGKWHDYRGVVTYSWLQRKDETPRLFPITIATQAEYHHSIHWCRGQFTDYKIFGSRVKILAD